MNTIQYYILLAFLFLTSSALALPTPKEGLLIPRSQAEAVRARVLALGDCSAMTDKKSGIRTTAERALF